MMGRVVSALETDTGSSKVKMDSLSLYVTGILYHGREVKIFFREGCAT